MQPFIRVIEIWTLSESKQHLEFNNGIYGPLEGFEKTSRKQTFAYGEGLPGSAWKKACPVVLKSFDDTSFLRTQAAHKVGLTSAVAIPIFSGETLKAVLVFLCGDAKQPSGAIEVWRDDGLSGLALIDGYFGDLERFEWLSKRIKFPRGIGLPGQVWDTALPQIADMSDTNAFLRSKAAQEHGITTVIAIPVNSSENSDDIGSVVTFLSSRATPIASRFEIWKPDTGAECLLFEAGIVQDSQTIEQANPDRCVKKGEGIIGKTWLNGVPGVATDLDSEPASGGLSKDLNKYSSILAIPIYFQETLSSVVVFYN